MYIHVRSISMDGEINPSVFRGCESLIGFIFRKPKYLGSYIPTVSVFRYVLTTSKPTPQKRGEPHKQTPSRSIP